MSCHGETGKPQVQGVPALAGRPAADLAAQLRLFRNGTRQNQQMVMAKRLTDEEIAGLEEPYLPHRVVGAIDRNPPNGVLLLDEKK